MLREEIRTIKANHSEHIIHAIAQQKQLALAL